MIDVPVHEMSDGAHLRAALIELSQNCECDPNYNDSIASEICRMSGRGADTMTQNFDHRLIGVGAPASEAFHVKPDHGTQPLIE